MIWIHKNRDNRSDMMLKKKTLSTGILAGFFVWKLTWWVADVKHSKIPKKQIFVYVRTSSHSK